MCGRYRLSRRAEIFGKHFDVDDIDIDWDARYNIAPAQHVPVIRKHSREGGRQASLLRWGLVPAWAKSPAIFELLINARSETAALKPAFKEALLRRRCLVPADGFYEWQRIGQAKQPYCFGMCDDKLFAFAGLWERWEAGEAALESVTILTTSPNELMAGVHDRMPVILPSEAHDTWLDPGIKDIRTIHSLLKPYDAREMRRFAVSTHVNNVAHDDPLCSEPVEAKAPSQASLF